MKFLSFYNRNKGFIWVTVIAIFIVIAVIHAVNGILLKKAEERSNEIPVIEKSEYKNNLDISVTIEDEEVKKKKELIIDQFIRYCNAGKINDAYNLLSDSCKENVYPTVQIFENNYIKNIFNNTKLYSKEGYKNHTYKIKLYEDIASTGRVNGSTIEDYFTIEKNNGEVKLNISNFIGEEEINKTAKNDTMEVSVLKKRIYKNYEEYTIQVKNLTDKDVLLDSMEDTKSVYLTGSDNLKFYAQLYETTKEELLIKKNLSKTITVKFNIEFNSNNNTYRMFFSDIIKDYEKYNSLKSRYSDRDSLSIGL